ncbi:hypothetical protein U1Q18_017461 [Sarracenia purpurea var. burkii]
MVAMVGPTKACMAVATDFDIAKGHRLSSVHKSGKSTYKMSKEVAVGANFSPNAIGHSISSMTIQLVVDTVEGYVHNIFSLHKNGKSICIGSEKVSVGAKTCSKLKRKLTIKKKGMKTKKMRIRCRATHATCFQES